MHKLLVVLIICMILSMGCAAITELIATPTPIPAATPVYYPDLSIEMRTDGTYSPGYAIIRIDGNGNVNYEAVLDSFSIWQQTSTKITPQQVEELVVAIKEADVFDPKLRVDPSPRCCDGPTIDLSITLNGQSKRIQHYWTPCRQPNAPVPEAVCELEFRIRSIGEPDLQVTPTP